MAYVTLIPAYGRDYPSGKACRADWFAGKDFTINQFGNPDDGRYINRTDAEKTGDTYNLRYKRLTGITVIKPTDKK